MNTTTNTTNTTNTRNNHYEYDKHCGIQCDGKCRTCEHNHCGQCNVYGDHVSKDNTCEIVRKRNGESF